MRIINPYAHAPFLFARLKELLRPGTFAAAARGQIGEVIDSLFEVDSDFEGRQNMSSAYPASHLAMWLSRGSWFDIEWLRSEDGSFYDDKGEPIDRSVSVQVSPIECLAAYGLWLVEEDAHCCGPSDEHDWEVEPFNSHGWSQAQVANHKGECFLVAYQLLYEAENFVQTPSQIDVEPTKPIAAFVAWGLDGVARKAAKRKPLKDYALHLYANGKWKSANEAAHKLCEQIRLHGRSIGVDLTEQNAQRTIAEWFRKSV